MEEAFSLLHLQRFVFSFINISSIRYKQSLSGTRLLFPCFRTALLLLLAAPGFSFPCEPDGRGRHRPSQTRSNRANPEYYLWIKELRIKWETTPWRYV
jgi:hypothetical protein